MNDDQSQTSDASQAQPAPVTEVAQVEATPAVDQAPTDLAPKPVELSWQASEYVQHHKNGMWYVVLVLAAIVLSTAAWFLTHSIFSIGVILVGAIALAVFAQRPPRMLTYELSADGLRIDGKMFPFHSFRSFSVAKDVAWHTIDLEPTQRFMPRMSVLFSDQDFDSIISHLLLYLPRVDRDPDFVDRATRYLRF